MKINYRQLSIMVFMRFIALKFLALPSLLYKESGNMSWLVALVLMLIDAIYAYLIIELMKRSNEKNIYEFMKKTLGIVLTKIFMFILMLKFVLVVANIIKGLEFFVVENLYNKFNWALFIFPLLAVVGFLMYKGLRNIGRVYEMFFIAIIVGCIYIGFKAIDGVDWLTLLPMFKDGAVPLLKSGYMHLSWFGSSSFLIMFFGKVDFKDEKKSRLIKYMFLAILLVQFLYIIFFGLYGRTSPIHNFAISDISQFYSGIASTDEISWLVVSLWIVAQAVQIAMYGYCLMLSIMFTFNIKNKIIPIVIIDILMFLLGYLSEKTVNLENFFFTSTASILTMITQYVIPLILWLGYAVYSRRKKVVKNEVKEYI